MDGSGDVGSLLKALDELDIKDYSPRHSVFSNNVKDMATSVDPGIDSNASDFDDSDEDLANLLDDDDDDDIFAKKVLGTKSPPKYSVPDVTSAATTKGKPKIITSPDRSLESPAKKITTLHKSKTASKDEFGDDALDQFLESNISNSATADFKVSSPEKSKTKRNSFQSEDDFLNDLDISQFSPSRDFSNKSPIKKTKSIDKSSNVLDDLNSNKMTPKTSEGRRGSFFDDFLQTLSPKKSIAEEKTKIIEENEDDILGVYVPTTPKNDNTSDGQLKSPKRKSSLKKQVSFKNLSDEFSESDISVPKTHASPEKDIVKQTFSDSKVNESIVRTRRSEKTGSNANDDVDWLNYFKDTPKKAPKPTETKKNTDNLDKADLPIATKTKPVMKRQSSADWLGLSDAKLSDDENDKNSINKSKSEEVIPTIKPVRPKTVNVPVGRHKRQDVNKSIDKWDDIDSNDFLKGISQPVTDDLSQILKNTDQKQSGKRTNLPEPFVKSSSETENIDSFSVSRIIKDPKITSSAHRINKSDDFISDNIMAAKESIFEQPAVIVQTRNLQENYELTSALQSVQSMLDDSIKERNKLRKENDDIRYALEEKIKTSEEVYKSEKKMLEDSFKTVESSLKKELEIKIKSLEERMAFISEEKEKQATFFEEKLQSIIKEHQIEVQKLKDLHSQSINIMKQDHEDAISRLKRLKDQEIEAVLSTQAHSKSLQYLSDQLETRANEIASLQSKIDERNQATQKERQILLDTKEKDLKALENRLHRQLEDSEAERTRLQQLVLRLESRLQKMTMEGEEEHWETKQLKAKLTIQQKYLEEEHKLSQYQLEKEKEKLKISQESLLNEQKAVLLQLAQERQLLTHEKIDLQSIAKNIREEEAKFNVKKLKEETSIESEKQFLLEEKNKFYFKKEKIKEEFYQLERERDSLLREKQQIKKEREMLHEQEINLKRKESQIEDMAAATSVEQDKGHREYAEALAIKKEQEFKMKQYIQQMQKLMEKEQHILSEREKLMREKIEFEQKKNSALCIKCKLSLENPVQVSSPPNLSMPIVFPLPNMNGLSTQVHQSFIDPNLVIWRIEAQKDREFLQEERAYLKSLKDSSKRKHSK